jgi:hypothetical protein
MSTWIRSRIEIIESNVGQLIAYIDRWWDLRRNLQARLEGALPAIQARARRTHEIAMQLLSEGRARRTDRAAPERHV